MKILTIVFLLSLSACGRESSPEGRSQIRDEKIQQDVNILRIQNIAILDSIRIIRKELNELKHKL